MNFIDLFAGAGGFTEGFIQAGYEHIASIEMDKNACNTLRTRMIYHWLNDNGFLDIYYSYLLDKKKQWQNVPREITDSIIEIEIKDDTIEYIFNEIDKKLNKKELDVIIGGIPCQTFSTIGRAVKDMSCDKRNYLYKYYFKFVEKYKPKFFVIENVPNLLNSIHFEGIIMILKY
jgi:DNA (cytosine-5)-methyltransferase 1